ncbi:hypothetical protein [Arcticibacter sp.]|jgi:hypothetical protein|uniref:hypothetical protein n=1 Tax=Arcticibacter sp. TaxID=1872630 RepID=UPI00388DADD3
MKRLLTWILPLTLLSCREAPKDFSSVSIGMTKDEVTAAAGEPARKNELAVIDVWVYPEADRSVIFRKDTVYNIVTSSEARIDSIETSLERTGDKVETSLSRLGDSLEKTGQQIKDKFRRDTTRK